MAVSWRTMHKRRKRDPVKAFGRWLARERQARWDYEDRVVRVVLAEIDARAQTYFKAWSDQWQ